MKIGALILILFFLGCSGYSSQMSGGASNQSDLSHFLAAKEKPINQNTGDVALTGGESDEDVPPWSQKLNDSVKGTTDSKWLESPQGESSERDVSMVRHGKGRAPHSPQGVRSKSSITPDQDVSVSHGKGRAPRSGVHNRSSVTPDQDVSIVNHGKGRAPRSSQGGKGGASKNLHEDSSRDLIPLPLDDNLFEDEIASMDGVITDNPYVDILFILDVSASMRKFLIQKSSDGFLYNINSLDWRIGFLSADSRNYGLLSLSLDNEAIQNLTFITPQVRDSERVFAETLVRSRNSISCVKRRQCGTKQEKPLGALNSYLLSSASDEFIRENADLAVIIVTNNDENRDSNWDMITSQSVLETFRAKYGEEKRIKGYSMTVMEESCRQQSRTLINRESNYAPIVRGFSERTEGGSFDICSASYADVGFAIATDQLSSVN